ncbi:MAG: PilZ domain-containing protein, partial [Desulfobacterales bacterium]
MEQPSQRAYHRHTVDIPFQYRLSESEPFRISRLINISESGLYFESERAMASNLTIEVLTSNLPEETCVTHLGCLARIRWRRVFERHRRRCYGFGVQFLGETSLLPYLPPPGKMNRCDLCDEKGAADSISIANGMLCLCIPCDGH